MALPGLSDMCKYNDGVDSCKAYLSHNLWGRGAEQVCDQLQLMHHIPAREQRLSQQDFSKDAANAPDVNCRRVLGKEGSTQLRCSVPSGRYIVCPEDGGWHVIE